MLTNIEQVSEYCFVVTKKRKTNSNKLEINKKSEFYDKSINSKEDLDNIYKPNKEKQKPVFSIKNPIIIKNDEYYRNIMTSSIFEQLSLSIFGYNNKIFQDFIKTNSSKIFNTYIKNIELQSGITYFNEQIILPRNKKEFENSLWFKLLVRGSGKLHVIKKDDIIFSECNEIVKKFLGVNEVDDFEKFFSKIDEKVKICIEENSI